MRRSNDLLGKEVQSLVNNFPLVWPLDPGVDDETADLLALSQDVHMVDLHHRLAMMPMCPLSSVSNNMQPVFVSFMQTILPSTEL